MDAKCTPSHVTAAPVRSPLLLIPREKDKNWKNITFERYSSVIVTHKLCLFLLILIELINSGPLPININCWITAIVCFGWPRLVETDAFGNKCAWLSYRLNTLGIDPARDPFISSVGPNLVFFNPCHRTQGHRAERLPPLPLNPNRRALEIAVKHYAVLNTVSCLVCLQVEICLNN